MTRLIALLLLITPATAGSLHPSIEDRRVNDDSLWTPLPAFWCCLAYSQHPVLYAADMLRLPKVPATHRAWMLRSAERPYHNRFIPQASDPFTPH